MPVAKGRRSGNARSIRLFEMSIQSALVELGDHAFDNEDRMHRLIEDNIQTLFPDLTFLTREFRKMAGGELRPDTIAFDTGLNTFVALEYKNRRNTEAVDQARTYLSAMEEYNGDLVLLYSRKEGGSRDWDSFEWNRMYAIIMAPEFGDYQITGAGKDPNVELYKIRVYDDRVMMMKRVGGGHERAPATVSTPSPSAGTPQARVSARAPSPGASTLQMKQLYDTIRARLLDEFPDAEETKKQFYNGFRYPGGKYFCTIAPQKSKIWLAYSGKRAASELKPGDFVRNVDGWGVGKLRSEIKNEDDLEKALSILKRLHAGGLGGKSDGSNSGLITTDTPGVFNPRYG